MAAAAAQHNPYLASPSVEPDAPHSADTPDRHVKRQGAWKLGSLRRSVADAASAISCAADSNILPLATRYILLRLCARSANAGSLAKEAMDS